MVNYMKNEFITIVILINFVFILSGYVEEQSRGESIPDDAMKYTPDMDIFPPIVHDDA